jgi:DNA end-binding protein Ku
VAPGEELPRTYGLLLAAMRKTDYFAVAKITMHDREHVVILRPRDEGQVAHTMFFENEMHAASKTRGNKVKFSDKELAMAGS